MVTSAIAFPLGGNMSEEEENRELPKEFEEYPELKKIVKRRKLDGRLTVLLTWFLGWNTLFQLGTSIILTILVYSTPLEAKAGQGIRNVLTIPNAIISAKVMQHRMYRKAKKRWRIKYESDS